MARHRSLTVAARIGTTSLSDGLRKGIKPAGQSPCTGRIGPPAKPGCLESPMPVASSTGRGEFLVKRTKYLAPVSLH